MQKICIHKIKQAACAPAKQTIDLQRLKNALAKVSLLVVDDLTYLPIFERIERELSAHDTQCDTISRARAIAAQYQMALA